MVGMTQKQPRKGDTGEPTTNTGHFGSKRTSTPEAALNVSITLTGGGAVSIPTAIQPQFRGVDQDGDIVVAADWTSPGASEYLYPLTPCCLASGKGSDDSETGVVCRGCYSDVDSKYGADHTGPLLTPA